MQRPLGNLSVYRRNDTIKGYKGYKKGVTMQPRFFRIRIESVGGGGYSLSGNDELETQFFCRVY